jgi:nitrite reductase/ring-hydroxylating ferredoxin subunit
MSLKYYKIFPSLQAAQERVPLLQSVKVVIGQTTVCLSHTQEGFFAVSDECTHLRESLSKGRVNNYGEVICPWHGYRFSLQTGEEATSNGCPSLHTYDVQINEEGFWIGI